MRHRRVSARRSRCYPRGRRSGAAPPARARLPAGAAARQRPRPGADGRARGTWPAARHPRLRRCRRDRAGGHWHGHLRRAGDRGGSALQLRAVPAARPSRRPRVARGLLLPQQRRGRGPGAARRRLRAGRDPRPGPALSQRDLRAASAHDRHDPVLAARLHRREPPLASGCAPAPTASTSSTFRSAPASETYLAALARCTDTLARAADAIVLSLGYDLVEGDPHGFWSFRAPVFERIGRLLARTELPVCVVQEGGYALGSLAECSHAFVSGLLNGSAVA